MKCVTAPSSQASTARPRLVRPAVRPIGASQARPPSTNSVVSPTWFDLPLQAVELEHVGNNDAQCTSYGVSFYRVKPATGGAGVATWIYDGDDDA